MQARIGQEHGFAESEHMPSAGKCRWQGLTGIRVWPSTMWSARNACSPPAQHTAALRPGTLDMVVQWPCTHSVPQVMISAPWRLIPTAQSFLKLRAIEPILHNLEHVVTTEQ